MPPEQFTPVLESLGADVIGLNCSVGPAAMLETLEHMAEAAPHAKLSAQPNAGRPRDVEGRNIYLSSPEYMASYARRFIASGVKLVGGCCGTTPEHVRHIKLAARALAPVARAAKSASGDGKARRRGRRRLRRASRRSMASSRSRASTSRASRTRSRAGSSSSPSISRRRAATPARR